jgi:DNA-binding response OmpR family regulator
MGKRDVLPEDGIQVFIPPAERQRKASKPTAMRILIMEDDPDVRTLLRLVLRLDGHKLIEASTPGDGLRRAVDAQPDLIVLDSHFPEADGIEALRELRDGKETRDVPIIVVSGKGQAKDQTLAFEAGADFYLTKPFDPLTLLTTIREVAGMSASDRAEWRVRQLARLRKLAGPISSSR